MRIAVLTSSYPRFQGDGTAPFVMSITESLAKLGHTIQVVAPYDISVKNDLISTVPIKRFKYIWPNNLHIMGHARSLKADVKLRPLVLFLLPFFLIASTINLIKECRRIDAQIIHAHWVLPNGFIAAIASKILGIPFIISLHGSDIFMADRNFLFRAIARWTFKQSSYVTACSQELYDRAKKINKDINIELIPWGANPEIFKPTVDRTKIREKYGWSSEEIVITTLGRMVYKKGFDQLILIAKELSNINTPFKIIIGGSGPLENPLRKMAEEQDVLDLISFPGQIPWNEVPDFLAASDIFVLPSRRDKAGNLDGLPTVLLEAMACGLPCIASDVGGVNLVINEGVDGFIFQPKDLDRMQKCLAILIENKQLRESFGTESRRQIIEEFNWENVAKSIEKLYQKSLSSNLKLRLGQQYRTLYLRQLGKNISGDNILDIGCHNPEWLNSIQAKQKVGIDLEPGFSSTDSLIIKGNGFTLPFSDEYFDVIFMLDVIEHVKNDSNFITEARRVLKQGGRFILTTPNQDIRIFPTFLTGWISRRWGHFFRRGYKPEELENLFIRFKEVDIFKWKAKYYLGYYFLIRLFLIFSKKTTKNILAKIVNKESEQPSGNHGFLVLEAIK
jgi:glycosyltransferase involved in cell wall biosynthesis